MSNTSDVSTPSAAATMAEKSTDFEDANSTKERRPLMELEFQVSQVIERLEAGAGVGERSDEALRKQSAGFLGLEEATVDEIIDSIENLIWKNDGEDEGSWPLMPLNRVAKLSIISHSIAAYAGSTDRSHLQKLNARMSSDCARWLSHLFRFIDCNACFHHDQLEGLVKITRMMLHYKYPRYLEDGGNALINQLPCIYSSVASPLGVVQHLCRQVGLPLACIRPVPVNSTFGSNQTMDVSAIQRMIAEDLAAKRVPLMVLADAGTTIAGHCDNIARLHDLCRLHDCWLHLRGHTLAALAVTHGNSTIPPKISDSITLPIGTWLGVPGLPSVTLYRLIESGAGARGREGTLPLLVGLTSDQSVRRLTVLPLWTTLRAAGRNAIIAKLTAAFRSCALVYAEVAKMPSIRILSKQPGGEGGAYTLNDLTSKPLNTSLIFEVAVSCVVFQFVPSVPKDSVLGRVPAYYDKLNSWLGQILQRDTDQTTIEICESETYGVVLRYCPFELPEEKWEAEEEAVLIEKLEAFSLCLEQQLDILIATVAHKETFLKLVEKSPTLRLVEMPGWAGLGGVRYVPEGWEELLTDQAKEELNNLNMSLVENLRATDAAFSLGEGTDGLVCVRFGMVTADTDVEELLNLVICVGRDFEENTKVLESMTEIVKKGIEAATMDLQRETTERLWQEGLLRHVPVVGRVVDWWSPPPAAGVRGRTLNLRQGTLESTENIYKYHMQIPSGTVPHGVSKAPPPAMVSTPVGEGIIFPGSLDSSHSRNSSHSSTTTIPVSAPPVQTQISEDNKQTANNKT